MNIYIVSDMEGISLVTEWEQVKQGHAFYPKYQAILTAEVNAAVEGAIAAGAKRIVINDGHGSEDYNLLWDQLNPKVEIERGNGSKDILPSLDPTFDAVLLVGYHAMEGTPNAVLAHTQSYIAWLYYMINGTTYGEIAQMALIAGHYGIPVAYISGDHAAVKEARQLLGEDLPATIVKWGHSHKKARSLHPAESVRLIRQEVERALTNLDRKPFTLPAPYEITIGFKSREWADRAATATDARRVDDFTIAKTILSAKEILG